MAVFPAVIDLGALGAEDGYRIVGDAPNDNAGISVSSAGDVNGDGYDDIIVGADRNSAGGFLAGAAYVIFGKAGGFGPIDLAALAAADGFRIVGDAAYDQAGTSVSSAGDINGDGFDDIIVGAPSKYFGSDAAYVILGKTSGFGSIDLGALSAADGFTIFGGSAASAGFSVSSAGDVNGDGFDDIIVGAPGHDRVGNSGGYNAGAAYVIFGKASGFANINLATLTSSDGFRITGDRGLDYAGHSVSSAGDVNGDGYDDIIVGALGNDDGEDEGGTAYVIFGRASGLGSIDLGAPGGLAPADGFRIIGEAANDWTGFSVSSAGDINGDGFDEIIVGAYLSASGGQYAGAAYVIFGKASGFGTIDLGALTAADGFKMIGGAAGDFAGVSVASAGDVNGDGRADLLVGARGNDSGGMDAGAAYVVFGRASGFGTIDLGVPLDGIFGFKIQGDGAGDSAGRSVAAAGDVNGDGYDDIIVGAPRNDAGGTNAGAAYVIFGRESLDPPPVNNVPGAQNVTEDRNLVFSAANGNAISVGDLNSPDLTVTLAVTQGTLTLATRAGLSFTAGDGASDSTMTFSGTIAAINAAISGLTYRGNRNHVGADTLTITTSDGALSDQDMVAITLTEDNAFETGSGDDNLSGTTGADQLEGANGDDFYIVNHVGDVVIEYPNEGNDTVQTALGDKNAPAFALYYIPDHVENLVATSNAGQGIGGNALNNAVTAGSGADLIAMHQGGVDNVNAGGGADYIWFGDTLTADDVVNGGLGRDTLAILGPYANLSLGANVTNIERLELFSSGGPFTYNITLADSVNSPHPNFFEIVATSLTASEQLIFDGSSDTDSRYFIRGGAGNDTLRTGSGNDRIVANDGNDSLFGNAGNDTLIGGMGRDTIDGGSGSDTIEVLSAAQSTSSSYDILVNFDPAIDRINVSGTFAGWSAQTSGSLDQASFDANLAAACDGTLGPHQAVRFLAIAGDQAGKTFVVYDANGDGSYTAGTDYVFQFISPGALESHTIFI